MKLFIPQTKEEFILDKSWTSDIQSNYLLEYFAKIGVKVLNSEIRLPKGTSIKIMEILMHRKKITGIKIQITKIFNKKAKQLFSFEVDLNDINRMFIESSATQGVLNIEIDWKVHDVYNKGYGLSPYGSKPEIDKEVISGYVNDIKVFNIRIVDFLTETVTQTDWDNTVRHKTVIKDIKYTAYELISGDNETLIGEWSTTQTCKKHLAKFLENNKSQFLDKNQKTMLRSDKLQRLAKEIEEN